MQSVDMYEHFRFMNKLLFVARIFDIWLIYLN